MKKSIFSLLKTITFIYGAFVSVTIGTIGTGVNVYADSNEAICQGIANDENNNILETKAQGNPEPRYRTLLKYDVQLGDEANTNSALATTGKGIYLNGVALNHINNALIDYANGSKYLRIKIPQSYQDKLDGDVILEVEEGTPFENKVLDNAKFALCDSKWKSVHDVAYTGIAWNDIGYEFYKDMKGILLNFDKNLSNISTEINGGIQSTNFASTVGEHIYLGGVKLSKMDGAFVSYQSTNKLFIYADNMSCFRTLKIEEGTIALNSILPEINLSYSSSSKWSTNEKEYNSVTYNKIEWNDIGYEQYESMKGILINFNSKLSQISSEQNGGIRLVNFVAAVGDNIVIGGNKLSDLPGGFVGYHSNNYMFIYCDNMSSYRSLKIEEGAKFLDSSLPEINLYYDVSSKWSTNSKTYSNVNFEKIEWNDTGYNFYAGMNGVLLKFDNNLSKIGAEYNGGIQSINYSNSVGEHIYLGGKKLSSLPGAFVSYHSLHFIFVYCTNMVSYRSLRIEEGAIFLDSILPEVNFNYSTNTKWSSNPKSYKDVNFTQIQWNDTGYNYYAGMNGVLLKYDAHLSDISSEINGGIQNIDYSNTVGEHIYLGGKKLSSLPGAFVSYHSQQFIFIYCDDMPSYRTLEIESGTKFMDSSLPGLTLYYTSAKWSVEKEDSSKVKFSSILWNNAGHEVYEGKNGLLLSYSKNLSVVPSEINGGIQLVNYAENTIGEKIKLDGTPLKNIKDAEIMYYGASFLWIYAPNMSSYEDLVIESCEFLTAKLPDTHFRFFGTEWAEVYKVSCNINGEEIVDYRKKSVETVLGDKYFSSLFDAKYLDLKLISFQVGEDIYYSDETLSISSDTTVKVTAVGFETTLGASVRVANPSGIRFENKIDKTSYDYIAELYGEANITLGTFIVPKSLLGLTPIKEYLEDESKVPGVDYINVVSSISNKSTAGSDGYYKYLSAFNGIYEEDFSENYCGVGYIKINDELSEYILYGLNEDQLFTRSVYEVIAKAYGDYPKGSDKNKELSAYLNGIVPLISKNNELKIDNSIPGYVSPYSIIFNSETNEYIVSGNKEIKSIMVNGEKLTEAGNVVKINGSSYRFSDCSVVTSESESTFKFKLSEISDASSLVDFVVTIPSDREMKILQITDTQIIDSSQMRSPTRLGEEAQKLWSRGNIDINCFNFIRELIETEQPDLILFTGDIVYGEFDDSGEIWNLMIEFMDSFGIPWAPIYGNHDNETKKGVDWQSEQLEKAQYCLFKQGNLTGNGNYSIGLVDENGKIRRVIYMLDSNGCLRGAGFGNDQIVWMSNTSSKIDKVYGEEIPSFACYHIASQDFENAFVEKYGYGVNESFNLDITGESGDFGSKNEKISKFSTTLAPTLKECNVDGVFIGHDHVNNYSIVYDGIRYTYGTKTGTYDYYSSLMNGGTLITVDRDGNFNVTHKYLDVNEIKNKEASSTIVTIFSDLHYDTQDYGGFYCTKTEEKFRQIISETQASQFYINLGDTVNSLNGTMNNYYEMMALMEELNLDSYNSQGIGYTEGNKMIYNLLGNHEVAYDYKETYSAYVPYVEDVGSASVFVYGDMMFVIVDAIYDRGGSDSPEDIIKTTEFSIPENEISWLSNEVSSKMDDSIKGIVWLSHVAIKDIDDASKGALLSELKSYNLPMTIFEGHTHIEAYTELVDEITGEVYCEVYTLPAVTLYNNYPYYNVTFRDGKVWYIDKKGIGEI